MKILFAGTPEIAVPSLIAIARNFSVVGVLTAPDRPSGRGHRTVPSPVKKAALDLGLTILQPERLNQSLRDQVQAMQPDILVVFAYGKIFGPKFLGLFPSGGINMHPSALPRYRGPAPITAVILAGETQTALTVQKLAFEMDSGDIIRQTFYPLNGRETTGSLSESVARDAAPHLVQVLWDMESGQISPVPQDHSQATFCRIITKADGCIDWSESATTIERKVRAYQPWPKARTILNGRDLAILEATPKDNERIETAHSPGSVIGVDKSHGILVQTGNGILALTKLQAASKKPMKFDAFMNGIPINAGMRLGGRDEN